MGDVIDRVPELGARAAYAEQTIRDKLIEHTHYIHKYGEDMPEILNWQWGSNGRVARKSADTAADF